MSLESLKSTLAVKFGILKVVYRILRNGLIGFGLVKHHTGFTDFSIAEELANGAQIFTMVNDSLAVGVPWLRGKRLLELGSGQKSAHILHFLAHGVAEYIAIDKYNQGKIDKNLVDEQYLLLSESQQPVLRTALETNRLKYLQADIFDLAEDFTADKFDLIISFDTLEHIPKPKKIIRFFAEIIKPGGFMFHQIDLRSHDSSREKHPLEFLTHSNWLWQLMTSNTDAPNRLRLPEYLHYFSTAGFKLLGLSSEADLPLAFIEKYRPVTHQQFQKYTTADLIPGKVFLALVKT